MRQTFGWRAGLTAFLIAALSATTVQAQSAGSVGLEIRSAQPNPMSAGVPSGRPQPSAPMPSPKARPLNGAPDGSRSFAIDKLQTVIDESVPLTPTEITGLLKTLVERQNAGLQNVTGLPPAKPVTSVETLDLSPGATPPVIRLTVGEATTLSFSDAAGRPWPIADNINANARAYDTRLIGLHLFNITLKSREAANITIVLKDLPRPIVITALPAGDETDYLKEYTVPKFIGGQPPITVAASSKDGVLSFNAPELINYLYRTPPKGARELFASGHPGVSAWQLANSRMVVRTSGQVVIPAFSKRHGSNDGVAVYELPLSPIVSITEGGALHRVSISGFVVDAPAAAAASSSGVAISATLPVSASSVPSTVADKSVAR